MLYLWVQPEYSTRKLIADYNRALSPNRFLFLEGVKLNIEEIRQCYAYVRSSLVDLSDDLFIRDQLRRTMKYAYIFTYDEMFCCAGGIVTKIDISVDHIKKLTAELLFTDNDIDKEPKILSDMQLENISASIKQPVFQRNPIFSLSAPKAMIKQQFDCIPNISGSPLVNQKIVDILLKVIPNEVQFFDAEVRCKDGILTNYKLLNSTCKIIGIDHVNSIYSLIDSTKTILGFKYLTYKAGCMGNYKLARDGEYLSNLLVTDEIKHFFEKEKVTGVRFARPEEYYRQLTREDIVD